MFLYFTADCLTFGSGTPQVMQVSALDATFKASAIRVRARFTSL